MRVRMEHWVLTSKNSTKLKQYYYFRAEFLEEIRYVVFVNAYTFMSKLIMPLSMYHEIRSMSKHEYRVYANAMKSVRGMQWPL